MQHWIIGLTILGAIAANAVPAQAQYGVAPAGGPAAQCLSSELKETIRQKKESARKTTVGEKEDPLDPDYFLGTWKMEWIAPDSPLGNAGEVTGTLNIRHIEGCYYEGALDAMGPDGAYKSRLQIVYDLEHRYLVWIENDSRGFTMVRVGPVGGDLGGYYTHFWEQPVIKIKDTSVRLRGTTFVQTPTTFLVRRQISVNADPYMNFGTVTFSKELQAGAGK